MYTLPNEPFAKDPTPYAGVWYAAISFHLPISRPYLQTLSGKNYIVTFIGMYSVWPEAFSVPNKKSRTIVYLLVNEIIPGSGGRLQLVTDNYTENLHKKY